MKEVLTYSAAVLAGFIGLAAIYKTGSESALRAKREAILDAIDEGSNLVNNLTVDDDADYEFMKMMGFFEEGADVPEMFMEDVKMYADGDEDGQGGRAGGRKQVQYVVRCMKSDTCKPKAIETVAGWGENNRKYIEGNINVLMHPVTTSYAAQENNGDIPICTPDDDVWACTGDDSADPPVAAQPFVAHPNNSPSTQLSAHPDVQTAIADASSSAMEAVVDGLSVTNSRSSGNVFGLNAGGAKIILIIPNGVPIHMGDNYQSNFGNYWGWFKEFNNRYIGINTGDNSDPTRSNFHFWFLRQDKNIKAIMSNPVKANRRFPWNRFDKLMANIQPTAAQPKLKGTYALLAKTVSSKNLASETTEGRDCMVFWFHQYIPQDLLELADSGTQEESIKYVDDACTVMHFWVGADAIDGDADTKQTLRYIQGLLQPSQISKTSKDAEMRSWYYVDDLASLDPSSTSGQDLLQKAYNEISIERHRTKCLLASGGQNIAAAIEAANEALAAKNSEYSYYGDETVTAPMGFSTSMDPANFAELYDTEELDYSDTTYDYSVADVAEVEAGPPDYLCCGRGLSGKKFDVNTEECCDDGSIGAIGEYKCML